VSSNTTTVLLLALLGHRRRVREPFVRRPNSLIMQRALFVASRTITDLLRHNKIWLPVVVVHAGMGTGLRVVRLGCCYGTQTVKEDSRTTLRSLVAQLVPCWTRTLPYGRWQSGESRQGHTRLSASAPRQTQLCCPTARRLVSPPL
jgi:hypothetical protein